MTKRRYRVCLAEDAEDGRVPSWAPELEADDASAAAESWAIAHLSCPGDGTEAVVLVELTWPSGQEFAELAGGSLFRVRVSFSLELRASTEVLDAE